MGGVQVGLNIATWSAEVKLRARAGIDYFHEGEECENKDGVVPASLARSPAPPPPFPLL